MCPVCDQSRQVDHSKVSILKPNSTLSSLILIEWMFVWFVLIIVAVMRLVFSCSILDIQWASEQASCTWKLTDGSITSQKRKWFCLAVNSLHCGCSFAAQSRSVNQLIDYHFSGGTRATATHFRSRDLLCSDCFKFYFILFYSTEMMDPLLFV